MDPNINLFLEAVVVGGVVWLLRRFNPVPTQTTFTFIALAAFLCTFGTLQKPTFMPELPWYGPGLMGILAFVLAVDCERNMRAHPDRWALLRPPTAMQRPEAKKQ